MILRSEKKGNYTILPNELLLDETISDKARGLLARLLSRPDTWNVNVEHLVATGKAGHTSVRSALRELEVSGYIKKELVRERNGKITRLEYFIYDCNDRGKDVADHVPDVTKMVDDHFPNVGKMVRDEENHLVHDHDMVDEYAHDTQDRDGLVTQDRDGLVTETDDTDGIHVTETCNMETAPVINTVIKQILKKTTTTAPNPEAITYASDVSSSSYSSKILNLIPERHRSPMVMTFVNKAAVDYHESTLKSAVAYAAEHVRGGSLQFRAYLDKTLKNNWADGWEPAPEKSADRQAAGEQFRSLPVSTLKMLADVGNVVAMEELNRRNHGMSIKPTAGNRTYARA